MAVCNQDRVLHGIENTFPFALAALEDFFQVVLLCIFLEQLVLTAFCILRGLLCFVQQLFEMVLLVANLCANSYQAGRN